ncbi:MAG: ATP-binding cassette domain-containing protein [Minwuia sp.]|nr:ATP-binding cassette domain-containing protein [Minwuia sp.]
MTGRHIALRGINKRFGALTANDDVDLDIASGACLALLGENGAGKSTLMKVLYGITHADSGTISIDGVQQNFRGPFEAMAAGIGMVFQQFSLAPALTVQENLLLASPTAPWLHVPGSRALTAVLEVLARLAPDIDPRSRVADLAVGERQLIELAKVLNLNARTIILDEPTSVLTPTETKRLYGFIETLVADGAAVIMITHKLADVEACADHTAIMHRGRMVHAGPSADLSRQQMVELMIGTASPATADRPSAPASTTPRVIVRKLAADTETSSVANIDLEVCAGELLGIAGVVGNGQTVLADALVGLHPLRGGDVIVDGHSVAWTPKPRIPDGRVAYVPEQPVHNAVVPDLDLSANLGMRSILQRRFWQFSRQQQDADARALLESADVRPPEPMRKAGTLSGGNLQKLVLGRELAGAPSLIVACYPTMGLDVAATRAVYRNLFEHLDRGAAIIWISEELDDLLDYAHRIAVLHGGRIVGVRDWASASRAEIGDLMLLGALPQCA